MKKVGNILYWVVIGVLVIVIASILYNRYKPNIELDQVPRQDVNEKNEEKEVQDNKNQEDVKEEENTDEKKEEILAPDFTLEDINGNKVSLSDYRGKIVFLNFWGVWCPYCIQEMPDLNKANDKLLKGEDAVIVTVDVGDTLEKVKKYVEEENITLPVLMDYENEVNTMYGVSGYPTTYVIGREGNILGRKVGPMTEQQVLNLVEDLK